MQKQWLEHFCKYRHICEFLGSEGKEKEEIKEYLMQELGLPEATARYQMTRALDDEDGIVKGFGWKFYLDEEKFKAVIEDLRSIILDPRSHLSPLTCRTNVLIISLRGEYYEKKCRCDMPA